MQRITQSLRSFFQSVPQAIKTYLHTADILLLVLSLTASALGLVLIYSATRSFDSNRYVLVQALAIVLGLIGFVIASFIDLDRIAPAWRILFLLNIGLQCLLIPFGTEGDTGNKSWIRFESLGIGIQPAELGKILFCPDAFASYL